MYVLLLFTVKVKAAQSCPTLCDPTDYSLQSSSVCGILQAIVLEWIAYPFSSGFSQPRIEPGSSALQVNSLSAEPPEKSQSS